MRTRLIIALGICLIPLTQAQAFDGIRRGFVLGGGLGLTPNAHWEVSGSPNSGADQVGGGYNLYLGGAFDEFNMLVFEVNGTVYESDDFASTSTLEIRQGFAGAVWYHYFSPPGHSLITLLGLGVSYFDADKTLANDPGFGIMGGIGYEFSRHWQFAVYVAAGKTRNPFDEYDHAHINVLVNAVAF